MKPKISIIVPVYNVEPYLHQCIESILEQTITDYEVLLVDDGSMDRSGEICDEFALRDNRIKVIHKKNGGLSSARNEGIKKAIGDYIGFVDGDDHIDPEMYEKLYEVCIDSESDIGICVLGRETNGKIVKDTNENSHIKKMSNHEAMEQLFRGYLFRFSVCNKLFKRSGFDNVWFPEGRIHEDLSTTYKLFANANQAIFVNYLGYIYVRREKSILTSTYNKKRLESFIGWDEIIPFIKKHYPQLEDEVFSSYVFWCIDNIYYILNQVKSSEDREKYISTIQDYLKKYYKNIIFINKLTLKNKYIISLVAFNTKILILQFLMKNTLLNVLYSFRRIIITSVTVNKRED